MPVQSWDIAVESNDNREEVGTVESNTTAVGRTRLGWGTIGASTGTVVEQYMVA